jgi:hypothetical protein
MGDSLERLPFTATPLASSYEDYRDTARQCFGSSSDARDGYSFADDSVSRDKNSERSCVATHR